MLEDQSLVKCLDRLLDLSGELEIILVNWSLFLVYVFWVFSMQEGGCSVPVSVFTEKTEDKVRMHSSTVTGSI